MPEREKISEYDTPLVTLRPEGMDIEIPTDRWTFAMKVKAIYAITTGERFGLFIRGFDRLMDCTSQPDPKRYEK